MTQSYDRFAGQNLAIALAAVRAENLTPPADFADSAGPAQVQNEGDWIVTRSAPGGTWHIARQIQTTPASIKQPLTAGALVLILVVLAAVVYIAISFATH